VRATLILDQSDALVVPRQAVVNKDGKNVVYRKTKTGAFDPVEVELGAGTSGRVVVSKGLSAGDEIALRDPTRSVDQAMGSGSAVTEEKPK
jgi:multidrug efflux pump subunit AcrA (membrane-fusion protein)